MGIESIFEPKCSMPLYLQSDSDMAQKCGRIDGIIFSIILSVFVGIFGYASYINAEPKANATAEEIANAKQKRYFILGICGGILILTWGLIPLISGFYSKRVWLGYDSEVKRLMDIGMSKNQAIQQVQALYQANIQAEAIRNMSTIRPGLQIVVPVV